MTHGEDAGQDGYSGVFFGDAPGLKLVAPSSFLVELTLLNNVHVVFNSGGCPCTDDAPFFGNAPVIDLYIVQTIFPPVFAGANDQPWIFMLGGSCALNCLAKSQHCAGVM